MRKIEKEMLLAIQANKSWMSSNTAVRPINGSICSIYLHNNHIANFDISSGLLSVNPDTLSRWPTPTTKSRLRALGANVATRKGVTYLDNVAI
jgi:hypothetical protein